MKKFLRKNWLLALILLLAAVLRFYHLGSNPPSLHWDETAIGYNAYSILKTGRDEYGQLMPLIFKSFGDYKPGLYIYLTVPSVALFGLNELAVRLPSALAGVLTVWLLYQLVVFLFKNKRLALWVALTLAFSPWHLQFSRGAWEANLALFLTLGGIYCFIRAQKQAVKWLYLAALSFGGAVLAYQGGKMIVPLLILGLLIAFGKKVKSLPKKHLLTAAGLLFLISLPILTALVTGGGGRLKVMSVFSYPRPETEVNQILEEDNGNQFLFSLFHSEPLALARGVLGRYFNHFSGKFLFFEGDWSSARHSLPYMGALYYLDFVFLLAGLVYLIKLKFPGKNFIWYWLLISPLPAAFSRDAIQSVRSLNMVLPLMIIVGCGLFQVFEWLKKQRRIILAAGFLVLAMGYLWCFVYYLDQYYLHYPLDSSQYWQYGYKQVINKVYPLKDDYQRIVFTQKDGQPYIYWLFYTQYSPSDYQKQAKLTENQWGDVGQVEKLDNIEFRKIYWPSDRSLGQSLFIGTEEELPLKDINPDQAIILEEVKFLNGQLAFRVVGTL